MGNTIILNTTTPAWSGLAVPTSTVLNGKFAIRVAITSYRSRREDFDLLVQKVLATGNQSQVQ